jgi:hypothetical protein
VIVHTYSGPVLKGTLPDDTGDSGLL